MLSRKGSTELYFLILALLIGGGLILYFIADGPTLDFVGKTSISVMNAFEFKERTFLYLDMSAQIAANEALNDNLANAGFTSVFLSNIKERYPCNYTVYPVLNDGLEVDKCFPKYNENFLEDFESSFDSIISNYNQIRFRGGDFGFKVQPTSTGDQVIHIEGVAPIEVPFYVEAESYFVDSSAYFNQVSFLTPEDKEIVQIPDIPNIICQESPEPKPGVTDFGRICKANKALIRTLQEISKNELQSSGSKMIITQAYRTYEIQKSLRDAFGWKACDPDKSRPCPHTTGGAIDVNIITKDGKNLNQINPSAVEALMCKYGFVRWQAENWHFELGTQRWESTQVLREKTGKTICNY